MNPSCHFVIPDTQITPESDVAMVEWIGRYICESASKRPERCSVVQLGDWHDMSSLSSFDKAGSKAAEGQRIQADLDVGNEQIVVLSRWLDKADKIRLARGWRKIERHSLMGNHEDRLFRLIRDDAKFEGIFGPKSFAWAQHGWTVHDFLDVLMLDGIAYSHYFYNPMTGRPWTGNNIELRLSKIGCSFSQGHQQVHLTGIRQTIAGLQRGLVSGRCYITDEDYIGAQGNKEWSGIIVKNEVLSGSYDILEVSLNYLARRFAGVSLEEWMRGKKSGQRRIRAGAREGKQTGPRPPTSGSA